MLAVPIKIKEVKEKAVWEDFFSNCEKGTFLNSWNWGEFQKLMKNKIWRLGMYYDMSGLVGAALIVKITARRGSFLFMPHGPAIMQNEKIKNQKPSEVPSVSEGQAKVKMKTQFSSPSNLKFKIFAILLEKLKNLAREESCDFLRISPILDRNEENIKIFRELGFREAPIHMHPEITWELDISPVEEKLLRGMRKTTRYLVRQAQKNNEIEIEKSSNLNAIEKFNKLYQATVNRQHFTAFSLEYLKNEFLAFSADGQISLLLAKYRGEVISGGIFVFWQETGFYHHGAATLKYPKIPASYLMLWEAIREAKNRGCKKFNFWGIAPNENKKHPWAGLTLFKMGFGGRKIEYVKTQDIPISSKYWLNYIIERVRRIKRGL